MEIADYGFGVSYTQILPQKILGFLMMKAYLILKQTLQQEPNI